MTITSTHTWSMFRGMLLLILPGALFAASPPSLIQYQGVLRSAADAPLTGTYDMVFTFFDAATGGAPILVDTHAAAGGGGVVVSGGLFSVQLGGGVVTDGSGPGGYVSLDAVFAEHSSVWVEVTVGAETLAPRTRVVASAYALNAANAQSAALLNGQPPGFYLDTSPTWQWKNGSVRLESSDAGHAVLDAVHTGGTAGTAAYFEDSAFTGRALLATADRGIQAYGSEFGGYFESPGWGSNVYLARDNTGIEAHPGPNPGSCAGRFIGAFDGTSHNALLGCNGGTGVDGYGYPGGHFRSAWGWTGEAFIGYGDEGMHGYGTFLGGYFADTNSLGWVRAGYSTYKVQGNGTVSFVQNHPYETGKVIVYAAPEGDEVAVYTRGSAKLVDGEARVKLGATFALVANPDIGLSAHVTPVGEPIPLAIVSKSTDEIVVRGPANASVEFDYIVWGLRIGFESLSIVQQKTMEAPVPAMTDHEAAYAADPSLREFSALERFRTMREATGLSRDIDMTRAATLLNAVGVYDPDRDGPMQKAPVSGGSAAAHQELGAPAPPARVTEAASPGRPPAPAAPEPSDSSMTESKRQPWLVTLPASGPIEAGDVVVLDSLVAGAVKRCDGPADRHLVGVAASADIDGAVQVAVASILDVLVDAGFGSIAPGDLLTTSETPGAAMRATAHQPGTIVGKALEPLESGVGTIRVLLMSR